MADEEVSHAFSHGYRPDHSERLAAYWAEALGGPPLYSPRYGDETSVVRIHSGNGAHEEMDRRRATSFPHGMGRTRAGDTGQAADQRAPQVMRRQLSRGTPPTIGRPPPS